MSADELEEPQLAALWDRLEDLWRSIDGATEHGHTAASVASLRRKLREASLHRRLGLGDYERWGELARGRGFGAGSARAAARRAACAARRPGG